MILKKNSWNRFEELIHETEELISPGMERDAEIMRLAVQQQVEERMERARDLAKVTIDDVNAAFNAIQEQGYQPNTLIMHPQIWEDLQAMQASGVFASGPVVEYSEGSPIGVIPVSGVIDIIPNQPVPAPENHQLSTQMALNQVRSTLRESILGSPQTDPNAVSVATALALQQLRDAGVIANYSGVTVEEGQQPGTVFISVRIQPPLALEVINLVVGANLEE